MASLKKIACIAAAQSSESQAHWPSLELPPYPTLDVAMVRSQHANLPGDAAAAGAGIASDFPALEQPCGLALGALSPWPGAAVVAPSSRQNRQLPRMSPFAQSRPAVPADKTSAGCILTTLQRPHTLSGVYDAAIAELALEHLDACSAVSGTSAGTPATPPRRIEDVSFSSGGDLTSSLDGGSIMMSLSLSGGDCSSSNLLSMSLGLSSPAITPCLSAASSAADWAWDGCAPAAGATPAAAASCPLSVPGTAAATATVPLPGTRLAAIAAAASAQMLPLELQYLVQQQLQEQYHHQLQQHQQLAAAAGAAPSLALLQGVQTGAPLSAFCQAHAAFPQLPTVPPAQPDAWATAAAALASSSSGGAFGLPGASPQPSPTLPPAEGVLQLQALLHQYKQQQYQEYQQQQLEQGQLLYQCTQGSLLTVRGGTVNLPPPRKTPSARQQPNGSCRPRQPSQAAEQLDPPENLVGLQGRYQPYCCQVISDRLNAATAAALVAVKALQVRDCPAATKLLGRRYFCSLKEVSKVLPSARILVVAPDVRPSPTAHINPVTALQRILRAAGAHTVPVVFALSRRGIGQTFGPDKMMSIVAIMQLEGLEDTYQAMVEEAFKGRQLYLQHRN